jgi:hypothetical protein
MKDGAMEKAHAEIHLTLHALLSPGCSITANDVTVVTQ